MNLTEIKTKTAALNLKLLEASVDFYTSLGLLDPRDLQNDVFGEYGSPVVPPYRYQSQKRGEALPIYITELQLRNIRDRSRVLCAENQFAISALTSMQNYVVGKGFTYRAVAARKKGVNPKLVAMVQRVIDAFTDYHELNQVEREALWRLHRDGEFFLRFFPQDSGVLLLRFVEPEHVRSPGDNYGAEYTFGIQTLPHDVRTVLGYWVVENPLRGWVPSFVPADEILHVTYNVDSSAKRGVPTFYAVEGNLRRVDDLLSSMTSLAKSRAKIAMIRKFNGTMQDTVQNFVNSLTEINATDPGTGAVLNLERLRYSTILNSSGGIEYEFPNAGANAAENVEVIQAELRAVAARLAMPSYMLTAKSDDVNYSSAMVEESPAVKGFEAQQRFLARRFGECRYHEKESVVWKQLRYAIEAGVLPESTYKDVGVQVEGQSLVTRDTDKQALTDKTYVDMGAKSLQTVRQEQGLDNDQERANIAEEPPKQPQPKRPGQAGGEVPAIRESKDATGHEHKGKGKGGGQFVSGGGAGTATAEAPVKSDGKVSGKKYGKSKAKVSLAKFSNSEWVDEAVAKLFGAGAAKEEVASAVGAPDDAEIKVTTEPIPGDPGGGLKVVVEHPAFTAIRLILPGEKGPYVKNEEFWMKDSAQGAGLGSDVFGRQVENCREYGFTHIECHAAKDNPENPGKSHNGYYTWPRLGYDAPLNRQTVGTANLGNAGADKIVAAAKKAFPKAKTVGQLMSTPDGRAWWKENGTDLFGAKFDLSAGSRSLAVFADYMAERAARPPRAAAKESAVMSRQNPHVEELELTPAEEEALSRAERRRDGRPTRESVEEEPRNENGEWSKGGSQSPAAKQAPHERAKAKLDTLRQRLDDHAAAEPTEYEPPDEPTPPVEPDDEPQPDDYDDPAEHQADREAWAKEDAAYKHAREGFEAAHKAWEHETEKGEDKYARDFDRWEAKKERLADRLDEIEQDYEEKYGKGNHE